MNKVIKLKGGPKFIIKKPRDQCLLSLKIILSDT